MVKPYFKISSSKRITIVDTTKQWKLDSNENEIPGSETITLDSSIYILSKNGRFVKAATGKK
jgi:hypothetical protein